jgi:tetratricopeptide (TPR) repeat protein
MPLDEKMDNSSEPSTARTENPAEPKPLAFHRFLLRILSGFKNLPLDQEFWSNPPYRLAFIWIIGISAYLSGMDMRLAFGGGVPYADWDKIWAIALIIGLLPGYITYWIWGSLYHLGVIIAGGTRGRGSGDASRHIYIVGAMPLAISVMVTAVVNTAVYRNSYFTGPTYAGLDIGLFLFYLAAFIYTIVLWIRGARRVQSTKPVRTALLFAVLPSVVLVVVTFQAMNVGIQEWERTQEDVISMMNQSVELCWEGEYDKAENLLLAARDKATDDPELLRIVLIQLGSFYVGTQDTLSAISYMNESLSYMGQDESEYHLTIGSMQLLERDIPSAITSFEKAVEIDSCNVEANYSLGLIYMGYEDEKFTDYEKALPYNEMHYEVDPDMISMRLLAFNYYELEMYADALPLLEQLSTLNPLDATVKVLAGNIYLEMGDELKAFVYFRDEAALDSTYVLPDEAEPPL